MPSWTPHKYQREGVKLLISQGSAGLLLDPGLGKTSISLAAFSTLHRQGLAKRMLIIAPLRPCYAVWPAEIEKWDEFNHLRWTIIHGKDKEKNLDMDADVFIINPEGLLWLLKNKDGKFWRKLNPDVICIDESTKFKNSMSKRFKLLKPFLAAVPRRWILTGTLVPNGLMDMWAQTYIMDLGSALGGYITQYRNRYFHNKPWDEYTWLPNVNAFEEITDLITPLTLRLKAEDHLDMPELLPLYTEVELPPRARKLYDQIESEFIAELEGTSLVAGNAAAAGTKCRQIANGAVYTEHPDYQELHSEKLNALDDLLEEILPAPVILLYEYGHDKERILQKYPQATCISDVPLSRYKEIENAFNAGTIPILMGHPASMGHGLNLQGTCHHVIWYGITWNFEYYDQAMRRVYRQGQKAETVFVYHLVAKDTKDTDVVEVLTAKERTQSMLYEALTKRREEMYGEVTEAELRRHGV